jgi:cyclopropane fatty-acyl-phospholipid synthase-like methyltransferase
MEVVHGHSERFSLGLGHEAREQFARLDLVRGQMDFSNKKVVLDCGCGTGYSGNVKEGEA